MTYNNTVWNRQWSSRRSSEVKLGLFGKEQEAFICQNGHKNNKDKEFCSICGKNIKGLSKNEVDKIEQFRNKIKVLTDMIAGK